MEPPFGNVQHALLTSIKYVFRYAVPAQEALVRDFDKFADNKKDFQIQDCMITCSWATNLSLDHECNS